MSLAHNRFCGPVRLHTGFDGPVWPPHCANSPFTRLTALFLHHNELDGQISPHLIARLGQLRFLNLSHNNLKGLFPASDSGALRPEKATFPYLPPFSREKKKSRELKSQKDQVAKDPIPNAKDRKRTFVKYRIEKGRR